MKARRFARWLITLRGSPNAIALGVAVGVFVAFTPTLGFQMVIAAFLATLVNASRPASVALVWVTNPLTSAPIFVFTYWVGSLFWSGPPVAAVRALLLDAAHGLSQHGVWTLRDQFMAVVTIGEDILVPLVIGGVLVGVVLAGLSYVIALKAVGKFRRLRASRRRR